jgi:hypothetical protein
MIHAEPGLPTLGTMHGVVHSNELTHGLRRLITWQVASSHQLGHLLPRLSRVDGWKIIKQRSARSYLRPVGHAGS